MCAFSNNITKDTDRNLGTKAQRQTTAVLIMSRKEQQQKRIKMASAKPIIKHLASLSSGGACAVLGCYVNGLPMQRLVLSINMQIHLVAFTSACFFFQIWNGKNSLSQCCLSCEGRAEATIPDAYDSQEVVSPGAYRAHSRTTNLFNEVRETRYAGKECWLREDRRPLLCHRG